jgi:hypothetical protein
VHAKRVIYPTEKLDENTLRHQLNSIMENIDASDPAFCIQVENQKMKQESSVKYRLYAPLLANTLNAIRYVVKLKLQDDSVTEPLQRLVDGEGSDSDDEMSSDSSDSSDSSGSSSTEDSEDEENRGSASRAGKSSKRAAAAKLGANKTKAKGSAEMGVFDDESDLKTRQLLRSVNMAYGDWNGSRFESEHISTQKSLQDVILPIRECAINTHPEKILMNIWSREIGDVLESAKASKKVDSKRSRFARLSAGVC